MSQYSKLEFDYHNLDWTQRLKNIHIKITYQKSKYSQPHSVEATLSENGSVNEEPFTLDQKIITYLLGLLPNTSIAQTEISFLNLDSVLEDIARNRNSLFDSILCLMTGNKK